MKQKRICEKKKVPSLAEFVQGSDENNLAEFPLALLTDSIPEGLKTLEFQDTVKDWKNGREVTRRVCVTGSDKYGLPTAKDDQVLAALVQLTGIANNFTNPEVPFTKHQVIELLHWDDSGWAYDRVEESLHRWKDVSVHYWNAWRDHEKGTWTDTEAVGVIDYFKISDGRRTQGNAHRNERSRFVWNRELFKSFQAGYMKPLDFGFYRTLKRPAAQRAYRLLDKRFFHQPDWEFDLRTFACEKLGFSRNYDTGQLKARLHPAMTELEQAGYIRPVTYRKIRPKTWNVLVSKNQPTNAPPEPTAGDSASLFDRLVARGISSSTAAALVKNFSVERIDEKIQFVDWLLARRDKRLSTNSAGFLVAAIRQDYSLSKDFLKTRQKSVNSENASVAKKRTPSEFDPSPEITSFLAKLSAKEKGKLEEDAIKSADRRLAEGYGRTKQIGGPTFLAYRQIILEHHVRQVLKTNSCSRGKEKNC